MNDGQTDANVLTQGAPSKSEVLGGYISEPALAAELGEALRTTQRRRAAGNGPPYVTLHRQILYRVEAVHAWLLAQERASRAPQNNSPIRRRRRIAGAHRD